MITLADIERVVTEKRAQMPTAQYVQLVVPRSWPDTMLGAQVRLVGSLKGKYIGRAETCHRPDHPLSLIDLKLSDADAWIARQRR